MKLEMHAQVGYLRSQRSNHDEKEKFWGLAWETMDAREINFPLSKPQADELQKLMDKETHGRAVQVKVTIETVG